MLKVLLSLFACVSLSCFAELTESHVKKVLEDQIVYLPVPKPAPPPPVAIAFFVPKPTDNQQAMILEAIKNTNALRAEKGLPALRYDENLAAYAQFRATEIEKKFSHERPNGEMYRASMSIGRAVGENIAAGRESPNDAILQFKNSPKHYDTILHDKFTKIGMGTVHIPDSVHKYYWVQIFGADNTSSAYAFESKPKQASSLEQSSESARTGTRVAAQTP